MAHFSHRPVYRASLPLRLSFSIIGPVCLLAIFCWGWRCSLPRCYTSQIFNQDIETTRYSVKNGTEKTLVKVPTLCLRGKYRGTNNLHRETSRPVRERFKEHMSDARLRKLGTGLGEHVLDKHTDLCHKDVNSSFFIEILSRNRDVADSKIDESIKIRDCNPGLNTCFCKPTARRFNTAYHQQDSQWVPVEYAWWLAVV